MSWSLLTHRHQCNIISPFSFLLNMFCIIFLFVVYFNSYLDKFAPSSYIFLSLSQLWRPAGWKEGLDALLANSHVETWVSASLKFCSVMDTKTVPMELMRDSVVSVSQCNGYKWPKAVFTFKGIPCLYWFYYIFLFLNIL